MGSGGSELHTFISIVISSQYNWYFP